MSKSTQNHHVLLDIARKAMLSRGFEPDFSANALKQMDGIRGAAVEAKPTRDLSRLLWCSIDNDDSRDLDQVTVAEELADGQTKIFVGIADVDAIVKPGTPIDQHAEGNTTTIYTGAQIFPMLPEGLSTDLTSLSENENRCAVVIEFTVDTEGHVTHSDIYQATVRNRAKLAYNSVSSWLEGKGALPKPAELVTGMDLQLRIQDQVAQKMRKVRHEHGALELESTETRAIMKDGQVVDLQHEEKTRAGELIEDFMIAANGVVARFLAQKKLPSIRRIVRSPERWEKIVSLAAQYGEELPHEPDAVALSKFLSKRRVADPLRFPDLSLTIVKLMGRGEYVLELPGEKAPGHFGLAVRDYTHSTAPNRRFPDLITHRLLKAAKTDGRSPYNPTQLTALAAHCTERENGADRVERQVRKSAAAMLLAPRIGESFDGVVTGASEKGTWARVFHPPVEGKVVHGFDGLDVGDQLRLKLIGVDVEKGFIDFVRIR